MNKYQHAAVLVSGIFLAAGTLTACGNADVAPVAKSVPSVEASASADSTYLVECVAGNNVQQPKTFTLACGDGNEQLQDLKWSNWGSASATATGSVTTNSCEPDCANGKTLTYDVKVTAKDLVTSAGKQAYTRLVVDASGNRPANTPAHTEQRLFDLTGKAPSGPADAKKAN